MGKKEKKSKKRTREASEFSDDSDHHSRHHKKHKKEKKEKRQLKEAKKFLKESTGKNDEYNWHNEPRLAPDDEVETITEADYYKKNAEFSEWLEKDKRVLFGDLPTTEAKELFLDFVKVWNDKRLPKRLYEGVQHGTTQRTSHRWALKGTESAKIKLGLEAALEEEEGNKESGRRWRTGTVK